MNGLTKRQEEVLHTISEFIQENSYPPTVRQVAQHFQISPKAAHDHIKALEKKGFLKSKNNQSRTIELTEELPCETPEFSKIPILGHVAAGTPIFSEANQDGFLELSAAMVGTGSHFILEVRGDSMINAGILDGDLAVFRYQQQAENGQIVVAKVEEAYTLKRLYKEKNRIKLLAENDNYPPIFTQNIQVMGKLVTLIRNY